MKRALVVGFGSIGQRHAGLLAQLGCDVAVVSRRQVDWPVLYADLVDATARHLPDYVVIANATGEHAACLDTLAVSGYRGTVLVEKPLYAESGALPEYSFDHAYVAYNLRFHPTVLRMRELLGNDTIISVTAHVGQYLPDWRPGSDYRLSYSAHAEQGGGVLRDLSHELDYVCWLLEGWEHVAAVGGHYSALEISSDDVFSLLMTTPRCPVVSVHLNYLDRKVRRTVLINTLRGTLEADLVAGTLSYLGVDEKFTTERNTTYLAMHGALLSGHSDVACSLQEGLSIVGLVEAAARAATSKTWVSR